MYVLFISAPSSQYPIVSVLPLGMNFLQDLLFQTVLSNIFCHYNIEIVY